MTPAPFRWLYVQPEARDTLEVQRAADREIASLCRRGVDHGWVVLGDAAPRLPDDPDAAWRRAEPIHLPGVLGGRLGEAADHAIATWHAFDRFRAGGRLLDEIDARLSDDEEFSYAGSTFDHADQREVEKVFVDVPAIHTPHARRVRDLSAKLSWIADDELDRSMRIRMSFGHESTKDWLTTDVRALWSDRLTERLFPETRCVTENDVIGDFLASVLDSPHRLSECIFYGNTPGGGAMFHHDADPGQRGVVFAQLLGATVWLACPKRELAERAAAHAGIERLRDARTVLAAMDGTPDADVFALLNATPALTADLAHAGWLFVVAAGDAILLPSHDADECTWHSVFGVGEQPSLALSLGVFDAIDAASRGAPPR